MGQSLSENAGMEADGNGKSGRLAHFEKGSEKRRKILGSELQVENATVSVCQSKGLRCKCTYINTHTHEHISKCSLLMCTMCLGMKRILSSRKELAWSRGLLHTKVRLEPRLYFRDGILQSATANIDLFSPHICHYKLPEPAGNGEENGFVSVSSECTDWENVFFLNHGESITSL